MFKFVFDRASNPDTKSYQFGITGLSAQLPSRVTTYTLPTITFTERPPVLIKSTVMEQGSTTDAFQKITVVFEPAAWGVVLGFCFGLLLLGYVLLIRFTGSYNPVDALLDILSNRGISLDEHDTETLSVRRTKYEMYRVSMKLISVALGLTILLL